MTLEELEPDVRQVVDRVTSRLLEQGAKAVVLTGSTARGRAGPQSDVDFFAIGDGPSERHQLVEGRMVGVHWFSPEDARQRLADPSRAMIAAFGWRNAIVVADPTGVGDELRREAEEWSWEKIEKEADAWVCDELVAWAEYIGKLASALEGGRVLDACAIRAETAVRLGRLVAVTRRITSESENGFWETIASAAGPEWRDALTQALACDGEDVETSAAAAIRLFALLAGDVRERLEQQQLEVVEHALGIARRYADA